MLAGAVHTPCAPATRSTSHTRESAHFVLIWHARRASRADSEPVLVRVAARAHPTCIGRCGVDEPPSRTARHPVPMVSVERRRDPERRLARRFLQLIGEELR